MVSLAVLSYALWCRAGRASALEAWRIHRDWVTELQGKVKRLEAENDHLTIEAEKATHERIEAMGPDTVFNELTRVLAGDKPTD